MSTHLPYQASIARVEDLHREARGHLAARSRRSHEGRRRRTVPVPPAESIAIRRATPDDDVALRRLAVLDSARPLAGDVLIADVEGEPRAAIEITTGATIADPFRPSAHLVDLLGVRAHRLAGGPRVRFVLGVLSRRAHRTA
jgi:hypothetical protein